MAKTKSAPKPKIPATLVRGTDGKLYFLITRGNKPLQLKANLYEEADTIVTKAEALLSDLVSKHDLERDAKGQTHNVHFYLPRVVPD